jgi:hypothetical protein
LHHKDVEILTLAESPKTSTSFWIWPGEPGRHILAASDYSLAKEQPSSVASGLPPLSPQHSRSGEAE